MSTQPYPEEAPWSDIISLETAGLSGDAEWDADMAYLRSLGNAIFEHARPYLSYPRPTTVYLDLFVQLSPAARRAVFGDWT